MKEVAIEIENLSKIYYLDDKFKQGFRERIVMNSGPVKQIQALSNLNLKIYKGDVIGIIGDNGSGKSTLLKIISGITTPSSGSVAIEGKVASILEVGTGFHPELSGRENIYFSSSVLGMTKSETEKFEQEIIEFSELQDFIDMQVKYYSSGMFMRLAFSVIAHIQADILLLDEVFSVGDGEFKRKCEKKLSSLSVSGRTILLVSHELSSVMKICEKFVWIDNGKVKKQGDNISIINNYISHGNNTNKVKETSVEAVELSSQEEASPSAPEKSSGEQESAPSKTEEELTQVQDVKDQEQTEVQSDEELNTHKDEPKTEFLTLQKEVKKLPYTLSSSGNKVIISDVKSKHLGNTINLEIYTKPKTEKIIYPEQDIFINCTYEKKTNKSILPVFGISYQLGSFSLICNPRYNQDDINISEQAKSKGHFDVQCCIPKNLLNNGLFGISLFFLDDTRKEYLFIENLTTFTIEYRASFAKLYADNGQVVSALKPKFKWQIKTKKINE